MEVPIAAFIATVCFTCIAGTWALSASIHNYKLLAINAEKLSISMTIKAIETATARHDVQIATLISELTSIQKTLEEVRFSLNELQNYIRNSVK